MIKAVVFDTDGTLLDTFEHIVQTFEHVLPQANVEPHREDIRKVIGQTLIECYESLAPGHNAADLARVHHEYQQSEEMYQLIVAYEGLHEALEKLKKGGVGCAVVSNRGKESLDLIFDYTGLADFFDIVISGTDVERPKPDPVAMQGVIDYFSINPSEIAMVGDTPIDIMFGKNAKVGTTIAMTHGFATYKELNDAGPDYILDSFMQLPKVIGIA